MVPSGWRQRAANLKQEVRALVLAIGDQRTPRHARLLAVLVVAYALSPLDLIPDPIPVLGYLDDVILIPAGVVLVLRLIPADVMNDARSRAAAGESANRWLSWIGTAIVLLLWLATLAIFAYATYRLL